MLADLYDKIREDEEELTQGKTQVLEVVFVSSDQDKHGFEEYYRSMPWMAVPFEDQTTKASLAQKFDVSGIPAFFVINTATGAVVDSDARSTVMRARGNARSALQAWKVI
jgi:nucleoredoxin